MTEQPDLLDHAGKRTTSRSGSDPRATALVIVDGVTKTFGAKTALSDLSFSIPHGQICGLLGPNGAGKTTLFRLLMGILMPTKGTLLIDDKDAFEDRVAVKRQIGYCPMSQISIPISRGANYSN
jgi:ABC-type multidrug transport system ATPase subunit